MYAAAHSEYVPVGCIMKRPVRMVSDAPVRNRHPETLSIWRLTLLGVLAPSEKKVPRDNARIKFVIVSYNIDKYQSGRIHTTTHNKKEYGTRR